MNRSRTIALLGTAALIGLSACTAPEFIDNDPRGRTKTGAVVGGVAGAIAGTHLAGDGNRTAGAVIGGVSGALIGAAIGDALDKQAAELRQSMDSRVQIINTGNELIVRMPNDLLFAFDDDSVRADLQSDLRELAASLQRYPGTTVIITGHTDNVGSASYNQDLSLRRARSVANVLTGAGVSGGRLRTVGAGESQPLDGASNLTEEGRARNRRVEIVIRPNG